MSTKPLAIIILAAGMGTRMKSPKPKVMHELAGRPMINWLLESCESLNPERIVVVVGPDMQDLQEAVKPHATAIQQTRDGTGGAVRCAMPALDGFDGDVLILLGDMPMVLPQTLQMLRDVKQNAQLSILGCVMDNPFGYGRLITDQAGMLHEIVEEKDANPQQKTVQLINTGAFCADGAKLSGWLEQIDNNNAQGEYYITQLPEIIRHEGGVTAIAVTNADEEVVGCNTRADLANLEATVQKRLRKAHMDAGIAMQDPETVYLWHDTQIGAGTTMEPNVYCGPGVTIGENVQIKAYCHFEDTQIGDDVMIGPFARLRPGTTLADQVRIGNFVEVKNSTVGKGSKINHLAYVGDAEMGEDVNFSAGAITVNYDGFEKHKTIIGKDVMVGSNVNLVAPLEIDSGAFIAAGSTITEDVPADALSIAREPSKIREGWAAKIKAAAKRRKAS